MAPDSNDGGPVEVPPGLEVPDHVMEASKALSLLRLQSLYAMSLIRTELGHLSAKDTPCTFQVLRWMDKGFEDAVQALNAMCHDADLQLAEDCVGFEPFTLQQIAAILDTSEVRLDKAMFAPFKLDDLPPGNPGEKEFERLLKPKIALNKSYTACMHAYAVLHTAAFSPTYKLGLSEKEYVTAWRIARRERLEAVLADIKVKLAENEKYTASLQATHRACEIKLADNDQMNFDSEIDPTKPVETGN